MAFQPKERTVTSTDGQRKADSQPGMPFKAMPRSSIAPE